MKKRMLLVGPGFGHNAQSVLESFEGCDLWNVTFLATNIDKAFVAKYPNVNFLSYDCRIRTNRPLSTFFNIIKIAFYASRRKYDVIYNLGMGGLMHAPLYLFARTKTITAFEIWSNAIVDSAYKKKGIFGKADAYILEKTDLICQDWWGIKEKVIKYFPQYENKWLMYDIGYSDEYFKESNHKPETEFVKQFLSAIPDNQTVCFWPRSIIPSTNHGLALEALGLIKQQSPELLQNFKLYIWPGNLDNGDCEKIIEEQINRYNIGDIIEIVRHPFVPQNDYLAIIERSDFFINIVNDDVLSTFIIEMITSMKPFVLSNLRTFQFLNEKYDLNINLVENNIDEVTCEIKKMLSGLDVTDKNEYKQRKALCEKYFSRRNVRNRNEILYQRVVKIRK